MNMAGDEPTKKDKAKDVDMEDADPIRKRTTHDINDPKSSGIEGTEMVLGDGSGNTLALAAPPGPAAIPPSPQSKQDPKHTKTALVVERNNTCGGGKRLPLSGKTNDA